MSRNQSKSLLRVGKPVEGVPPESTALSTEDEKMMEDLKKALHEKMPINHTLMVQFVRGYSTEKTRWETTLSKLTEALAWRETVGADTVLNAPLEREEEFFKLWPHDFHGFSKNGHPVYIEDTCCSDPNKLLDAFTEEEQRKFHVQMMETLSSLKASQSKATGLHTYKHIVIMDLNNLGRHHISSKFSGSIKSQINIDQYFYPESLHRLYIINAPWVFRMAWAMIKPWVHPLTASRVEILGSDYSKKLLEVIDADQLPRYLGGSCSCCPEGKKLKDISMEKYQAFVKLRQQLLEHNTEEHAQEDLRKQLPVPEETDREVSEGI